MQLFRERERERERGSVASSKKGLITKKKKKRETQNTKRRSNNFYPNHTLMSKNIFGITNQSLLGFDVIDEESNESYSI